MPQKQEPSVRGIDGIYFANPHEWLYDAEFIRAGPHFMTGDRSNTGEAPLHPELEDASLRPPLPPPSRAEPSEAEGAVELELAAASTRVLAPATPLWTTFRDIAGVTDRGLVESTNEDGFLTADLRRALVLGPSSTPLAEGVRLHDIAQGTLLAVADGMAGRGSGAPSATTSLEVLARHVTTAMPWLVGDPGNGHVADGLRDAFLRCQERLRGEASRPGTHGRALGTTFTVAYVVWPIMYIAHVGAGRCYRYRGSWLSRLTTDHELARPGSPRRWYPDDADAGDRPAGQAGDVRARQRRGSVGGIEPDGIDVEIRRVELARGDRLLLCTDGLTRHVSERELARFLDSGATCAHTCDELVSLANKRGGEDNASVIVGWL